MSTLTVAPAGVLYREVALVMQQVSMHTYVVLGLEADLHNKEN